jgi:hypothetical protein
MKTIISLFFSNRLSYFLKHFNLITLIIKLILLFSLYENLIYSEDLIQELPLNNLISPYEENTSAIANIDNQPSILDSLDNIETTESNIIYDNK